MKTLLPGFTADGALARTRVRFRPVAYSPTLRTGVYPAQDRPCATDRTSADCRACWQDCINGEECIPRRSCFVPCRGECGGQPPDNMPIPCTPRDNSVNRTVCTTGIDAWQAGAEAVCKSTLGAVPVVGPALAAACAAGSRALAAQMKNDCPPAVICV